MWRFILLFALVFTTGFALELWTPINHGLIDPWTGFLARVSGIIITLLSEHVSVTGRVIRSLSTGFAISIEAGCNGVEATLILVAAMLAFPSPWKKKLIGLLWGIPAVQVLNVVRIVSLFFLGDYNKQWFEWAHLYLWQALIMLDVLVVWLLWLRSLQSPAAPVTEEVAHEPQ